MSTLTFIHLVALVQLRTAVVLKELVLNSRRSMA